MRWIAAIVALCVCGCYSPHYDDCFVSCANSQLCPSGLSCDGVYCRTSTTPKQTCPEVLGDAGLADGTGGGDVGTANDRDGDTITDADDNCPGTANTMQEDEDSDGMGDVCDPCPPFATYYDHFNTPIGIKDANLDSDMDGVGDGCDPDPMVSGDHILVFAGFKVQPPPPAMINKTGNANITFDGAANVIASTPQDTAVIGWAAPPENKTRIVSAQVHVVNGSAPSLSGGGTLDRGTITGDQGMSCALWKTSQTNGVFDLLMLPTTNVQQGAPYAAASTYVISQRHNANTMFFSCSFEALPFSGPVDLINNGATMQANTLPTSPVVGIRATSANVRYDWVMVVD